MSFWEWVIGLPANLAMGICDDGPVLRWVKYDWALVRGRDPLA